MEKDYYQQDILLWQDRPTDKYPYNQDCLADKNPYCQDSRVDKKPYSHEGGYIFHYHRVCYCCTPCILDTFKILSVVIILNSNKIEI